MAAHERCSLSDAGSRYAELRCRTSDLDELERSAIAARDFTGRDVEEAKPAELLVYEAVPFGRFDRIGVISRRMADHADAALDSNRHSDWSSSQRCAGS